MQRNNDEDVEFLSEKLSFKMNAIEYLEEGIASNKKDIILLAKDKESFTIPTYWDSAVNLGIKKIRDNQFENGTNTITFAFVTDMHYHPDRPTFPVHSPNILAKVMRETGVKHLLNGGDTNNQQDGSLEGLTGREIVRNHTELIVDKFRLAGISGKMLTTHGNHDCNTCNWYPSSGVPYESVALKLKEFYSLFFRDIAMIDGIVRGDAEDGMYYYVDDQYNKIRYLVGNTCDVGEYTEAVTHEYAFRSAQINWIMNVGLDLPDDEWDVIFFTHVNGGSANLAYEAIYIPINNSVIIDMLTAFKNKTNFFSNNNNKISHKCK